MAKIGHMKWSRCTGFFPGLSKWGDVHNGHDRQTKHQFGSLDVRTKLTHSYGSTGWTWLVAMFNPGKLSRKKSVDKNITSTKTGPLEGKLSSNHEFAGAVSFREGKHSPKHHDFFWRMAAYPFIKRIRGGIPWFFFHITHRDTEKLGLLLDERPSRQLERMKLWSWFPEPVFYLHPS